LIKLPMTPGLPGSVKLNKWITAAKKIVYKKSRGKCEFWSVAPASESVVQLLICTSLGIQVSMSLCQHTSGAVVCPFAHSTADAVTVILFLIQVLYSSRVVLP
jgi:hypothetical protein